MSAPTISNTSSALLQKTCLIEFEATTFQRNLALYPESRPTQDMSVFDSYQPKRDVVFTFLTMAAVPDEVSVTASSGSERYVDQFKLVNNKWEFRPEDPGSTTLGNIPEKWKAGSAGHIGELSVKVEALSLE